MNADVRALLQNVAGGFIVALLSFVYLRAYARLRWFHLRRVLGTVISKSTTPAIAYGQLSLPPILANGVPVTHPYIKPPRLMGPMPLQGRYSIEHPVSECEVRAATHIARLFGQVKAPEIRLISDITAIGGNEGSFISLGGPGSNYKTADILACDSNIFIQMQHAGFTLASGVPLPYNSTIEYDHGFILRVRSPFSQSHSLIACAGLGEWGTSGAAWYLAKRWETLMKYGDSWRTGWGFLRQPDFLAIIKVTRGQDDSAKLVAYYRKEQGQCRRVIPRKKKTDGNTHRATTSPGGPTP
jgi:hypothetical protein